jgi:hypothetical protein
MSVFISWYDRDLATSLTERRALVKLSGLDNDLFRLPVVAFR